MEESLFRAIEHRPSVLPVTIGFATAWTALAVGVAALLALALFPKPRPEAKRTLVDRVAGGSAMYVTAYFAAGSVLVLLFLAQMD